MDENKKIIHPNSTNTEKPEEEKTVLNDEQLDDVAGGSQPRPIDLPRLDKKNRSRI